ncbi:hypothetical protein VULLAG_LOCUS15938 [Vulpes lagopus]
MLMILMNLQAAPKENAGAVGADELECEQGSGALCVRDGEDRAAPSARQIRGRNWVAVCLCVIVRTGYGHVSWFILGPVPPSVG